MIGMNRKVFIKQLRSHLKFLDKKALEEEVLYYINKIDKSKKSDEEVIKSFGSMEDIVHEVCKRRKIEAVSKKDFFIVQFYNDLVDLGTLLKNCDGKKRGKILLDLLVLVLLTCFLKIPFIFIRDLGDQIIDGFFNSNITFFALWGLVMELIYVLFALSYFVRTFRKWFGNLETN